MSGEGRLTWFPFREEGTCSSIAGAACAGAREERAVFPPWGAGGNPADRVRGKPRGDACASGGAEVIVRGVEMTCDLRGPNERSLLLEIRYGSFSAWLPGDVERGPSAWGEDPREEEGGKRVVLLPHHGVR